MLGSDQVGIYLAVCGNVVFHPHELNEEALNRIDEYLGLERHPLTIGGSTLVGALVTGNSKGLAVADIATEADIDTLQETKRKEHAMLSYSYVDKSIQNLYLNLIT